jgi:hypothetical protein
MGGYSGFGIIGRRSTYSFNQKRPIALSQKVTNGFTAVIDNDTIMSLMVYNMNGSVVISQKINAQSAFISCSHLPSGIYLVKTKLGKRTVETKILKLPN